MRQVAELIDLGVASSELLENMGDVLEIGILAVDRTLVIQGCNRWLATTMSVSPGDVIGRPLLDVFPGLADGPSESAIRSALGGSTVIWSHGFHGFLLELPPPAGHEQYEFMQQSARMIPIQRTGEVEGVFFLIQDVTERVATEQALKQAVRAAEVASQAKSDFLASMSHELRTPLSAIVGYMDLLIGDMVGSVPPLQKSYLGRVAAAARHLVAIIEEILTFSRVEAGREPVYLEEVDVTALLRDAKELLEPQAKQKNIAIGLMVPDAPVIMRTDPTKLRQIVLNLLGNAIKFTDAGHVVMKMLLTADRVVISVADTGPGIGLADTERIFEPFTQIDQSLKRTKGGTGLGLPVSRRLAHLLQGDLSVESSGDDGTTFVLWLPLVIRDPSA